MQSSRRGLTQAGGPFAEVPAAGAQRLLEDEAMFGLRAATVRGGSRLQRFDDVVGNVPDEKLCHAGDDIMWLRCCPRAERRNNLPTPPLCVASGVATSHTIKEDQRAPDD